MRLDILAEIDGKEKINIEMQNKNEYNIVNRNDGYASGIYYNSLQIGDKYLNGTKTVVIWILGYNYFKDGNYHEIIKQRREYNNEVFSPNITTHIFQLPRFIENVEEIKTEEEQWLAYLSGNLNKEEKEELFKMNRSIEEINKIDGLKRISKPGLRVYASCEELPKVLNGLGIALISTSKGIMTDKKARELGIGGEVLAYIW